MKNQLVFSVFFSLLLGSTLGHDYLRAHHLINQARHHKATRHLSQNREAPGGQCSWVCPAEPNPPPVQTNSSYNINLLINAAVNVIGLVNDTGNVGIAFDIEANLAILLNGNSGAALVLNLETNVGIVLNGGSSNKTWTSGQGSFTAWLQAAGSLKAFLDISGEQFQLGEASVEIRKQAALVLTLLSRELASHIQQDLKAVAEIVDIAKFVVAAFRGSLGVLIKGAEFQAIKLAGGLMKFVGILKGLINLGEKIAGGLEAIIKADIQLKLYLIFGAITGAQLFVGLFAQLAEKIDVSALFGNILKSSYEFFDIILQLSGGNYAGANGVLAISHYIKGFAQKSVSLEVLIDVIIKVSSNSGTTNEEGLKADMNLLVEFFQNQTHNKEAWSVVLTEITDLQAGKLIVGGINLAAVVELVVKSSATAGMSLAVGIIFALQGAVGLTLAIPTLFLRILVQLNVIGGIQVILKLIPNISINIDMSSSKSAIEQIVAKVQISSLIKYIVSLNIIGVITHLPVIGDIYLAIGAAVKTESKGSVEITSLFKGSAAISVMENIQAIIWAALHVGGSNTITTATPSIIDSFTIGNGGSIGGSGGNSGSGETGGTGGGSIGGGSSGSTGGSGGGSIGDGSSGSTGGTGGGSIGDGSSGSTGGTGGGSIGGGSEGSTGGTGGGSIGGSTGGSEGGSGGSGESGSGTIGGSTGGTGGGSIGGGSNGTTGGSGGGSIGEGSSGSTGGSGGGSIGGGSGGSTGGSGGGSIGGGSGGSTEGSGGGSIGGGSEGSTGGSGGASVGGGGSESAPAETGGISVGGGGAGGSTGGSGGTAVGGGSGSSTGGSGSGGISVGGGSGGSTGGSGGASVGGGSGGSTGGSGGISVGGGSGGSGGTGGSIGGSGHAGGSFGGSWGGSISGGGSGGGGATSSGNGSASGSGSGSGGIGSGGHISGEGSGSGNATSSGSGSASGSGSGSGGGSITGGGSMTGGIHVGIPKISVGHNREHHLKTKKHHAKSMEETHQINHSK